MNSGARTMLTCRFCQTQLDQTFVDLGMSPVANAFVRADSLGEMEPFYPLRVFVCPQCFLVQLPAMHAPDRLFDETYAYFSSYSDSWLAHCRRYAERMVSELGLCRDHCVVEVASNDGYLLQYFRALDVPVLGIEPAANCAAAAERAGIPTEVRFFGRETAAALAPRYRADLMIGNNVLAHVPDIDDFVAGFRLLLKPEGVATLEFPHLLNLIERNEFDTIYHEHYSYLSFCTVERIFAAHGLTLYDVEELPTHGGSLRVFARCAENAARPVSNRVAAMKAKEQAHGLTSLEGYAGFEERVRKVKRDLLSFLIGAREEGRRVAGYGAPAKGNTLLNYCGVRSDLLDFTVDRSPHKQGCFLPGVRIPIHAPEKIREARPDFILILPWNLQDEIVEQMRDARSWGARFVVCIPELRVLP